MDHYKLISRTDISQLEFLFDNLPRKDLIPKLEAYKEMISNEPFELKIPEEKIPEEHCSSDDQSENSTENVEKNDEPMSLVEGEVCEKNLLTVSLDDSDERLSLSPQPMEEFPSSPGNVFYLVTEE